MPDGWLNVALYLPAGALLTAVTRRPVLTVACLAGLSMGVEVWQALTLARTCAAHDVVANTLGAALGAAIGAVAITGWSALRRPSPG
jgi:glycopeptide antibiotics resistance protein